MTRYIMRLDDASEYMDTAKWTRMEHLLDYYGVKPIVGIIPDNKDGTLIGRYPKDEQFWSKAYSWIEKGWCPALHGCEHRYITNCGGLNPINPRSEFAGVSYEKQAEKIRRGVAVMREHDIHPFVFFAPSHTFDENTLKALIQESDIRIVSDTIASDIYSKEGLTFVPQQSGRVRKLGFPFRVVTFCYHPNMMEDKDFESLELFLEQACEQFCDFMEIANKNRKYSLLDFILCKLYFLRKTW